MKPHLQVFEGGGNFGSPEKGDENKISRDNANGEHQIDDELSPVEAVGRSRKRQKGDGTQRSADHGQSNNPAG